MSWAILEVARTFQLLATMWAEWARSSGEAEKQRRRSDHTAVILAVFTCFCALAVARALRSFRLNLQACVSYNNKMYFIKK